jgi:hypothetical protein
MVARFLAVLELAVPTAAAALLLLALTALWVARVPYPYDLEWMEGGMLAHAWRLANDLPLYVEPQADFVPFVYPPGYSWVVATLGGIFGLAPATGRVVSLFGSVSAAVAISYIVQRQARIGSPDCRVDEGSTLVAAVVAAVAFLGTYPATGAFFDLVRPDGLLIGLLAWSIALGLETDRKAVLASGLLLFLAFLVKHNAAAFGPALALGIGLRSGWRASRDFALVAAVPSLLAVLWLQWQSEGRFLEYLLAVPRSHPSFFDRVWPGTFQELGTPLPLALGTLTAAFLWLGMHGQQTLPLPATTFAPVAVGVLSATFGTYVAPGPDSGLYNVPSAVAFFALGAVPTAFLLYVVGAIGDRWADRESGSLVSWRFVYGIGIALTALVASSIMRAHNGGYLNVHIQLFWVVCVGFGVVLERMRSAFDSTGVRVAVAGLATAQLLWALALLEEQRLAPTEADLRFGKRLVDEMRQVEGEVFSPFAAWLPVYAGKPPSLHFMGLWDLEHPDGPFYERRGAIREAIEQHRWPLVLGGNQKFGYGLQEHYKTSKTMIEDKDKALMPKTGWRARPNRLMVPSDP